MSSILIIRICQNDVNGKHVVFRLRFLGVQVLFLVFYMKLKKLQNYCTFLVKSDYSMSIISHTYYFQNFLFIKNLKKK